MLIHLFTDIYFPFPNTDIKLQIIWRKSQREVNERIHHLIGWEKWEYRLWMGCFNICSLKNTTSILLNNDQPQCKFSALFYYSDLFSLVVICQRRMNILHFLGTTFTALETLRREINISVLTVRTGEKHNRHCFCHRKSVRERREELLDSLTRAPADWERNHFRELGDVVGLTWAQTPGAESQKHQAHQLNVQSCHHLSAFWEAGPDRETLKELSLSLSPRAFSCLQLALKVRTMQDALASPYIYTRAGEWCHACTGCALPSSPSPLLSLLPPPFPLSLISSPTQEPWLKVTIFSNCSCCSGFLTHGKSCSKAQPYTAEKAPLVAFFLVFSHAPAPEICHFGIWKDDLKKNLKFKQKLRAKSLIPYAWET